MKIELPLNPDYVDWNVWAAVREFLQNAKDAETLGFPSGHNYNPNDETLLVRTRGTVLSRETLILGQTNKRGDGRMIGHFGEGYKLAALALLRRGLQVSIRTGTESWVPSTAPSAQFGGAVTMLWNIQEGLPHVDEISVIIKGITPKLWEEIQDAVLWLRPPSPEETIQTTHGSILRESRFKGLLYVKGLFVAKLPGDYEDGYNLVDVTLDRDRKLAEPWALNSALTNVWDEAMAKYPATSRAFLARLQQGKDDIGYSRYHNFSADSKAAIAAAFHETYGQDAIPCGSLGEAQNLENLGARPAVVSREELEVFEKILPKAADVARSREKGVKKTYQWSDFSQAEKDTILRAVGLLERADSSISLAKVSIVDFNSERTLGIYSAEHGDIYIARHLLTDPVEFLATMAHEWCHARGSKDGTASHEHAIEALLSRALWYA